MHSADVASRVKSEFLKAELDYPPKQLAFIAFKDMRKLVVFGKNSDADAWKQVLTYPVLGQSGSFGPKLQSGDMQVPEGIYKAEFLNANSRFHLSIRLDYPNAFDRQQALLEGRSNLGSDIMIHGTNASIGCLAMGNQAAEDLFVLSALAGKERTKIIVVPTDLRTREPIIPKGSPLWLPELYAVLKSELLNFSGKN
jgi:murein L,D-transpeptidase YafK